MSRRKPSFWSYDAPETPQTPPVGVDMTQAEWEMLTPAYRREISRSFERKPYGN